MLSLFLKVSLLLVLHPWMCHADVLVTIPSTVASTNVVYSNFLGISIELSFMDQYFGNDTSSIPSAVINYLTALRERTVDQPLRLRIGGNSMDSSTYVPSQTSPMVQLTNPNANANNQPVNYGPVLWDVLKQVGQNVSGIRYLIGLSLLDPNSTNVPLLAGAAQHALGDDIDAFLLGNEPDLYTSHGNRPALKNYTTDDYITEFETVSSHLTNTSAGDLLDLHNLGGPTICCSWDLASLLQSGYLSNFTNTLKYITLQHYPQNNCFGSYQYELPWYLQHSNVVSLAAWQKHGIQVVLSNPGHQELIMDEFNSASCGGIPGVSDTFGVGSLWTADYALQMASVGYSAAYLHTREAGISYNLFAPPNGSTSWTTNPPYYALLAVAEALQSPNGSLVVDLNLSNSMVDYNATVSGYSIYDAKNSSLQRIVLFNYANTSAAFTFPANASDSQLNVTIKYLTAPSVTEKTQISWGGETLAGVGDGILVNSSSAAGNIVMDCTKGCTVDVPGPAMAVLLVAPTLNAATVSNITTTTTTAGPAPTRSSDAAVARMPGLRSALVVSWFVWILYHYI